jgi:hypothetical protein
VSVSASRTVTMLSLIVVFALVGPRPVYCDGGDWSNRSSHHGLSPVTTLER